MVKMLVKLVINVIKFTFKELFFLGGNTSTGLLKGRKCATHRMAENGFK
jgi:hypothetical protein